MQEITGLLRAYSSGDKQAMDQLMPLVERELKQIAHGYMRKERPGHILQTTALVNEAIMKLIRENISYENRKHFYALVARRMRQVLIDYARRESAARRGNRGQQVEFKEAEDLITERSNELLMLDQALTKLALEDETAATIVECHFFIGLTFGEIAELLDKSRGIIEGKWKFARAWLHREMTAGGSGPE